MVGSTPCAIGMAVLASRIGKIETFRAVMHDEERTVDGQSIIASQQS